MKLEEHTELINNIRNAQTDVERSGYLATLMNDYKEISLERDNAIEKAANLEKENVEYAKLNNQLFLQIGTPQQTQTQQTQNQDTTGQNTPPQKRSFDDLAKKFD